ncbi:hypothetical protein [Burkholderia guangdongensis]|uniref:hypothetical protein n=1 Tax=Burkholderia guangdongensis TaxID=1792500 RepID=UPI0015CB8735|nr:hypothetical protein [Burkholderia guangdongensis]
MLLFMIAATGYAASIAELYQQIPSQKNADGTITIFPHSRPSDLNELHQRYCESIGGKDITDEGDTTITAATIDAATCLIQPSNTNIGTLGVKSSPLSHDLPPLGGVKVAPNNESDDPI